MTLTLAFDTSADSCSVALLGGDGVLAAEDRLMTRGHTEALVPMVMRVMETAGKRIADLDTVGVTVGPGSFTGIRTGIAAARGFALASRAEAVGVSTLEAVAYGALASASGRSPVMCILDTRRAAYFVQDYDADRMPLSAPAILESDAIGKRLEGRNCLLAGNGVARFAAGWHTESGDIRRVAGGQLPCAADVGRLADLARCGQRTQGGDLVPLYLQAPHTTEPKQTGGQQ